MHLKTIPECSNDSQQPAPSLILSPSPYSRVRILVPGVRERGSWRMRRALVLSALILIGVASYLVFAPLYALAFVIESAVRLLHHLFLIIPAEILDAAKDFKRRSTHA